MGLGFFFWNDDNVLELVVTVAQPCKYTTHVRYKGESSREKNRGTDLVHWQQFINLWFDRHFQSCIDQRQNPNFQFMSSVTYDKLLNSYNAHFSLYNGDMQSNSLVLYEDKVRSNISSTKALFSQSLELTCIQCYMNNK